MGSGVLARLFFYDESRSVVGPCIVVAFSWQEEGDECYPDLLSRMITAFGSLPYAFTSAARHICECFGLGQRSPLFSIVNAESSRDILGTRGRCGSAGGSAGEAGRPRKRPRGKKNTMVVARCTFFFECPWKRVVRLLLLPLRLAAPLIHCSVCVCVCVGVCCVRVRAWCLRKA